MADHTLRVLIALLTAGFPPEIVRVLGLTDLRLREAGVAGMLVLTVLAIPTILAVYNAIRHPTRLRCLLLAWIACGTLPLLWLQVTPESYHLLPVLPAVFILWLELVPRGPLPRDTWHDA